MKKILVSVIILLFISLEIYSHNIHIRSVKLLSDIASDLYIIKGSVIPPIYTKQVSASLSGRILSKVTNEPLAGAVIYIPDLKSGTTSDENGYYTLKNLPQTSLLLQVSFLGYKTIVSTIDLEATTSKDFLLETTIVEMNELVITGSSRSSEIRKSPVPISVMDRKEIDQVTSTNIIDAITLLPGVNAVTTGPNISKPFIHGMGYNRVLTLVDGIRQEGQQWGDEHGIEVDENSISKVEIVKGPSSLIYGSDALAGVINLITYPSVSPGEIKGSLTSFYQTNNRLIGSSAAIDGNNNGLVWGGRLSYKMATNYKNRYDGRVYGTSFRETDAEGYAGLNKKWGYSRLNFSAYNNLQMVPDGSRDSMTRKFTKQITEANTIRPIVSDAALNSYKIGVIHQQIQHYKIYSSNNIIFNDSKIGVTLGYQRNIRHEFSHPEAASTPGLSLNLNTFTYDAKYYFPDVKGWETTVGLNGMAQNNQNKGTEFIIPDYRLFDFGPFLHVNKNLDKFDLSFGIRYDSRHFSNSEMFVATDPLTGFQIQVDPTSTLLKEQPFIKYNHTYTGISGSIGVTWQVNEDFAVKANIARGFRAPNISEISANGVHPGTNIYQIGNLDSTPEFSTQEDVGLFYALDC